MFRLDSEDTLFNRMKQEAREKTPPERITFPEEPVLSRQPYFGRSWPLSKMFVEPSYLCHKRLLFEIGLTWADLQCLNCVPLRRRSIEIGSPVHSWCELREAA